MKISSAKWRSFCLGLNVLNMNDWSGNEYIDEIVVTGQYIYK